MSQSSEKEPVFSVKVSSQPDAAIPAFAEELRRINVLMGANGSGKSQLLNHLAAQSEAYFGPEYTPVLIEGGRVMIHMQPDIGLSNRTMGVYSNPESARISYRGQRRGSITGRIQQTLVMLRAIETVQKTEHSDEVQAWVASGQAGQVPKRDALPLERLRSLFNDVFPHMALELTPNLHLHVKRGTTSYPITQLSDGEKQVLLILAEVVILTNERSVFLVDEPELNLHPALAESLWSSIEQAYPNDVFIYATHSLPFAMRSGVETLHVIGYGALSTETLLDGGPDLQPFLGALPGIIRAKSSLAVEGEDTSFDAPFYKWLLGTKNINIVPAGGSGDVMAAANRQGLWRQISPDVRLRGVVDRDFRSPDRTIPNVVVLELHEAESYLCDPAVVLALRNALGNQTTTCTQGDVISAIVVSAEKRLLNVVAQRVFARATINLRVSVERSGTPYIRSLGDLTTTVQGAAASEVQKAQTLLDPIRIAQLVSEEERICQTAISNRNVDELLKIFEAKPMVWSLANKAGCANPQGMLNAVMKHLKPEDFPHLKRLRDSLLALLA